MDAFEHIRRAAADRRSGAVPIALRAAKGLAALDDPAEVRRAARILLRAHPAMAPLWRLLAAAGSSPHPGPAAERFAEHLQAETAAVADAVRWLVPRRGAVVLTHSSSSTVLEALRRLGDRVERVVCTRSMPGGEGRALARRLGRDGFAVDLVHDAEIADACRRATVALVGADAVTEEAVVNKVGTRLVALAARDAGIGCYAIAGGSKMIPARIWRRAAEPGFEATPLGLLDAVVTERGPLGPGRVRRAVARIRVPRTLSGAVR